MSKPKRTRTSKKTVQIDPEVHAAVKAHCDRKGIKLNHWVSATLKKEVA
jgi:predicted HicB family RNase H-like nuclease